MITINNRIRLVVVLTTLLLGLAACQEKSPVSDFNGETETPEEAMVEAAAEAGDIERTIALADSFVNLNQLSSVRADFLEMVPNAPIGLWPGLEFEGEEIDTIKGSPLFIYTDGLNEAENSQQEQFGDHRLLNMLRQIQYSSARQVVETMAEAVTQHRNGADPNDDLTMMCIHYFSS